jgi:hypothetical protein
MSDQNNEWIVIAKTFNREEAQAWRDLLRSAGIEVSLEPDVDHVELIPGGAMSDQYEISVPSDQEQTALEAMKEIKTFGELDETEEN